MGKREIIHSVHFLPSNNWDKINGFQIDRTAMIGC
jgi:hypothetical protein